MPRDVGEQRERKTLPSLIKFSAAFEEVTGLTLCKVIGSLFFCAHHADLSSSRVIANMFPKEMKEGIEMFCSGRQPLLRGKIEGTRIIFEYL